MPSSASSDLSRVRGEGSWRGLSLVCATMLLGVGCEPSEYQYGFNVTGELFRLHSENAGIHPHDDVLADPNNPFREYGVGSETKWDILASGGNVATFYAWSTTLVGQPTGEHQFYTGTALQGIYEVREVVDETTLPKVREMAIRAYQAVLDHFPESVTYDATGERSSRLATFAFNRILDLGGQVQGDWVLVETPSGGTEAVRSSAIDPPRPDDEEDP